MKSRLSVSVSTELVTVSSQYRACDCLSTELVAVSVSTELVTVSVQSLWLSPVSTELVTVSSQYRACDCLQSVQSL